MTIWSPLLLIAVPTHSALSTVSDVVVCLVASSWRVEIAKGKCKWVVMVPSGISSKVNIFISCWKDVWVGSFCSICICLVSAFLSLFLILNILSYCREDNFIDVGECH